MYRRSPARSFAGLVAGVLLLASAAPAEATDPEPENAAILGTAATLIPIAVGTGLLLTERGPDEGVRLASGLTTISLGAAVGPYAGQLYAGGGTDGLVTFALRSLTTGVFTTGLTLRLRGGEDQRDAAHALMVLGAIPTLLLAGYDIIDSMDTARESRIRTLGDGSGAADLFSVAVCGPIPCAAGLRVGRADL